MKMFKLRYTLKNPTSPLFHEIEFDSELEAQKWVEANSQIYWHEIVYSKPSSKENKIILKTMDSQKYSPKNGVLQTFYETGMECLGLILQEDGIWGPVNPNFDPSKPEGGSNFKHFSSYEAITFIENGQVLEIDGQFIGMLKDPLFAKQDGYNLSFYPRGFTKDEWISLFLPENKRATLWIKKK